MLSSAATTDLTGSKVTLQFVRVEGESLEIEAKYSVQNSHSLYILQYSIAAAHNAK